MKPLMKRPKRNETRLPERIRSLTQEVARKAALKGLRIKKIIMGVESTAYNKDDNLTKSKRNPNGLTALGTVPHLGTFSVDPQVIPLGTAMYVEGSRFGRAEDKGGRIKGNKVDVYRLTVAACYQYGVHHNCTVFILEPA